MCAVSPLFVILQFIFDDVHQFVPGIEGNGETRRPHRNLHIYWSRDQACRVRGRRGGGQKAQNKRVRSTQMNVCGPRMKEEVGDVAIVYCTKLEVAKKRQKKKLSCFNITRGVKIDHFLVLYLNKNKLQKEHQCKRLQKN